MPDVDADELREHLAYEVHYLVLAAVRFAEIDGVHKGVYQDSALVHARNLFRVHKTPVSRRATHGGSVASAACGHQEPTLSTSSGGSSSTPT